MVWLSSAQGIRPYAPPTSQTVHKIVTQSRENRVFCPFSFQSLAHSFAGAHSTTPLQSYSSALFSKNTGGRYPSHDLPLVFRDLRTLAPLAPNSLSEGSGVCERLTPLAQNDATRHSPLACPERSRGASLLLLRALCGKFLFCVAFPCYFLPSATRWSQAGGRRMRGSLVHCREPKVFASAGAISKFPSPHQPPQGGGRTLARVGHSGRRSERKS